jgi:hypothetical protein
MLRRGRFDDVVRRQLDLFAADHAPLLEEAAEADAAWTAAAREESEELYGRYQLVVDEIGELLYDTREAYASTLDEQTGDAYRAAFNRSALKRFRRLASFLEEDT